MSGSGSSLRSLVLTPQRIPPFVVPSRSPLVFVSPRFRRMSPDRTRLLSDPDDDTPGSGPPRPAPGPTASPRFRLRLPRVKAPGFLVAAESADADMTTRAAMSLPQVGKVTTPYGFSAALAATPNTRRRESLFHRNKPPTVTVTEPEQPGPAPGRSRVSRSPGHALQLLKKPAAALKALSPAPRRPHPC